MSESALHRQVRQLLAIADDGGATEAERTLAAKRAAKLVERHNLTLTGAPAEERWELVSWTVRGASVAHRRIAFAAIRLAGGEGFYHAARGKGTKINCFGTRETGYLAQRLSSAWVVDMEVATAWARVRGEWRGLSGATQFRLGYATRVRERVEEMLATDSEPGTALVLASQRAEFTRRFDIRTVRGRPAEWSRATAAGLAAGDQADLSVAPKVGYKSQR